MDDNVFGKQTRKEKREWKELFGNSALSENQLIDKTLLIFAVQLNAIPYKELFKELFDTATGQPLEFMLNRILTQLLDDELIRVEDGQYRITGKGIRKCKIRIKWLRPYPYRLWRIQLIGEIVFFKFFPIVISSIALIVSYLLYLSRLKAK